MMFKSNLALPIIAAGLMFTATVEISTSAKAATNESMPGSLTYHKTDQFATIGSNYKSFKLYNHVPTSSYKNIKTISWKKARMSSYGIVNSAVHIDLYAFQGTQYNWYRISKANVLRGKVKTHSTSAKQKVQKYWVYGQALIFPKTITTSVFS